MKIQKEELWGLLQTGASVEKQPVPEASPPTAPAVTTPRYTALHRELGTALPRLWAKAQDCTVSRSEHRKKLRELLAWLLQKKNFNVRDLAPMRYSHGHEVIDGKLDLSATLADGTPALAVEADWTLQESSLLKLKSAHEKGFPVLWVVGAHAKFREDAREARHFAVSLLGRASGEWLLIYHLEHGWV